MIISSFPNLSIELSYAVEDTFDFGDLCIIFIVFKLKANALDSLPIQQDITPNTTFFFVFITTPNKNLFASVGRQLEKFLLNQSYLKLSLVVREFVPKNLQHYYSKSDLYFGILQRMWDTVRAVLAVLPAFLSRKAIIPSISVLSGSLPNADLIVLPNLPVIYAIYSFSYFLSSCSFSLVDSCSLPISAYRYLIFSSNVFTLQLYSLLFSLSFLFSSFCKFKLFSETQSYFLALLCSSLSLLTYNQQAAFSLCILMLNSSRLYFSQLKNVSEVYSLEVSYFNSDSYLLSVLADCLLFCYVFSLKILQDWALCDKPLFYDYKELILVFSFSSSFTLTQASFLNSLF